MSDARSNVLKPKGNPVIDPGPADDAHKIIVPKNTTAHLAEIANQEASLAYDTDLQQLVVNDGSGFSPVGGGGGGSPGGADTNVQFNDAGSFGGDPEFAWDSLNKRLGVGEANAGVAILQVTNPVQGGIAFFGGPIGGTDPGLYINNTGNLQIHGLRSDQAASSHIFLQPSVGDITIGATDIPGNVTLQGNTLKIQEGSEGTAGYVLTSVDTVGTAEWMPASGGGADVFLSNLTAPTAIPVDLLTSDGTASLGAILTQSFQQAYISDAIRNANGIRVIDTANRRLVANNGTTVADFNTPGLLSVPVDLTVTGTSTLSGLIYPSVDGSSGDVLTTDGAGNLSFTTPAASGANTNLSNLGSTAVNASIIPAVSNTIDLGSGSLSYANAYSRSFIAGPAGQQLTVTGNSTSPPSGDTSGASIFKTFQGAGSGSKLAIFTDSMTSNADQSGRMSIETGNNTGSGGTGGITIRSGMNTGGGTRGEVSLDADRVNANFGVLRTFNSAADPTTVTAAAGDIYFNTTLNKLKVYNGTAWETITSA